MDDKPSLHFENKIKLDYSPIHGRGIFATENIDIDQIVEICPLVVLDYRMRYHHDPMIWDYCFTQVCPCEDCKKHGGHFLMVLGYGQVYNHHDNNNADIKFDVKNKLAFIKSNREIKKGEEIFVSYGPGYFKSRKHLQNPMTTTLECKTEKKEEIKKEPQDVFRPL